MEGVGSLTERQREVLTLLAKGLSNGEIAGVLGISASTVKSHVENVLRALNVTNRTEAAGLAAQLTGEPPTESTTTFAERPAIAVLRFDVEPDTPLMGTFASGLVDDLVMLLCKWRWFPVIAKSTSFYCKNDQPVAKLRELTGAAYLISGSITLREDRLRVTVRLDDARNEWCLWSERFDLPVTDIFTMQDEVATAVVGRAYPEIMAIEGRRAREARLEKLTAWQLAQEGMLLLESGVRAETQRALECFDRAIGQDSRFVLPVYGKGMGLFDWVTNQWSDRIAEDCADLERCAERAIALDENDASGWVLAGRAAMMLGAPSRAIPALERATEINTSHARAHSFLGQAYICEGNRAGFESLRLAARLCPRLHTGGVALAYFSLGEYAEAISNFREALARRPDFLFARALYCASLALGGEKAAARAEVARLMELHPDFRLANLRRMIPRGRHDTSDRIADGLRQAGLRE